MRIDMLTQELKSVASRKNSFDRREGDGEALAEARPSSVVATTAGGHRLDSSKASTSSRFDAAGNGRISKRPRFTKTIAYLLAISTLIVAATASPQQTSITLLDCNADLCPANTFPWTITKTANTSGLVNGSGPIVWTINVVKDTANVGTFAVKGSITIQNTGGAPADIGNIVISLQKPNSQKIGGKLVPWVSVAADVADATSGDAATSAKLVGEGSSESQPFNAAYGSGNYTVSGVQGTFTETSGSGSLAFTDASNNTPFSLTPQVSMAPGATLTLLYTAGFDIAALGLSPGTSLRVEALVSFANAGARGGSGAAVANIDINGNGLIDSNEGPAPAKVRTVPCRVTRVLPAAGNDSVTLSDMPSDVVATGADITFNNFATDIGGGTGTEVINASVTRTVSVNVSCSGTSAGNVVNTAHLDGAASACGSALVLDAISSVPISCSTGGTGGFRNGEFCTYNQDEWGTLDTAAATLLEANFFGVYTNGYVEIGIPGVAGYSAIFSPHNAVLNLLPTTGVPGPFGNDSLNPTSTSAGVLAGFVLALRLDVDFNAAGLLSGTGGQFAGLVLCNFSAGDPVAYPWAIEPLTQAQADALNGLTVREFLAVADTALGGGPVPGNLTYNQLAGLTEKLTESFIDCQPSAFAQAHLCRPTFQPGEFCTHIQDEWGAPPLPAGVLLANNYNGLYASSFGIVEVGLPGAAGYSIQFTGTNAIFAYQPSGGLPAPLNADLVDPISTASGVFGGEVLALRLNIDFSDAGLLGTSGLRFGDLILCNLANGPNGISVRQFLDLVNTALGGGATPYNIVDLSLLLQNLNASFLDCSPLPFAQAHLRRPTFQPGEFCTYNQFMWGDPTSTTGTLLNTKFDLVYFDAGGVVEVGLPGTTGFAAYFTSAGTVLAYLPAIGNIGALNTDLIDPTTTSAGAFGGQVLALKLNVDFDAAGHIGGTGGAFANLQLCHFSAGDGILIQTLTQAQADAINGQTVAQILAEANRVLGGGTGTYGLTLAQLLFLLEHLNAAFSGCDPSAFAQTHLCR